MFRAISLIAVVVSVSSATYHPRFAGQSEFLYFISYILIYVTFCAIFSESSILSDLFEFIAVIPYDEVEQIVVEKADNDPNVRATLDYFHTEDFQMKIDEMSEILEFKTILNYLEDHNTPAHDLWNLFRMIMGLDPVKSHLKFGPLPMGPIPSGPMLEMMDEILAAIDPQEIKEVYDAKIKESEDFNNLVNAVENEKFEALVVALKESMKFKDVLNQLNHYGFDFLEILNKVAKFFLDAIQA